MRAKALGCAILALALGTARGFVPPVDTRGGVTVALVGFDEERGDPRRLACAKHAVTNALAFQVRVVNDTARAVSGPLKVWLNDDWAVDGTDVTLDLAPRATQTVSRTARALGRVLPALYPVHATFGGAHAVGVFEATGAKPAWTPPAQRVFEIAARTGSLVRTSRVFALEARGERFRATVSLGENGVFDGSIAFASVENPACAYRIDGFSARVLEATDAPLTNHILRVETREPAPGALEVVHWLTAARGGRLPLRARFSATGGALALAWDMPGVTRSREGLPRYESLSTGFGDRAPERVYAGFGNVIERPAAFRLGCGGFEVSTRHVGADFPGGFSLVEATAFGARALVHDPARRVFGCVAPEDNTFYYLPSAKGAFRAARNWRDVSGFKKAAGHDRLVGKMCFDEWGGDYSKAAAGIRRAARYGLTDAVFVKHCWQRWGYDYRLPDIYPPRGDAAAFADIARACRETGVVFAPHDNYTDFYPDAEGYSYDMIAFDRSGLPRKAWLNRGRGARSYRWHSGAFMPYLKRNCALLREGVAPGGLFIDVLTAAHGGESYDRAGRYYPRSSESAAWGAAFDAARGWLGIADAPMISEAGDDHLVGHVDAGQSDHFPWTRWAKGADGERVPWHDMASHGRMILYAGGLGDRYAAIDWSRTSDRALHGWASDDYLSNAAGGGRAPMCAGPFNRKTVMTYWLQHDTLASLARAELEGLDFADGDIHRYHTAFSNGGEVFVNRATNRCWRVAGHTLPPYGYCARTPAGEAGIVIRDGQRCAFSRTGETLFADARPDAADESHSGLAVRELSRTRVGPRLEVELEWTVRRPLARAVRGFVHVIPKGAKNEDIVRHGRMDLKPAFYDAGGTLRARLVVEYGGLDPAKHDVYYGLYDTSHSGRLPIFGMDGRGRMLLGAAPGPDRLAARLRELGVNTTGKMLDFGGLRTNGALKFTRRGNEARIMALPDSFAFDVELEPAKLGLAGLRLARVEPALKFTERGGKIRFAYDPKVEGYRLVFAPRGEMRVISGSGGHPRVLVLGNSLVRHGPRPQIGWTNDWGMAASARERDFAHRLAASVREEFPASSVAIANVADLFERKFAKGLDLERDFGEMRAWQPDAVVMFFGANCPRGYDARPDGAFGRALEGLRAHLANGGRTKFLFAEGFYDRPALDAEKRAVAKRHGDAWAPMADIRARRGARGRFDHPSDAGMALIAERLWDRLEPLVSFKGPMHLYGPVNFDPSNIPPYTLEDPLAFADGTRVKTPADWPRRRAEILGIFAREMYGQPPPPPDALAWEVISEKVTFAGFARHRHVRMWFKADRSGPAVDWHIFLPRHAARPVPPILQLNYRGVSEYVADEDVPLVTAWSHDTVDLKTTRGRFLNPNETSYLPLPMLLARGYAFMTAAYGEVSPDPYPGNLKAGRAKDPNFPYTGVFTLWPKRDPKRTDNTTALGAWAWALSRGLDLAERMEDLDATRAVVTGCSRLGKAALIAAARDERFRVCVVNQSGGGGVTLTKHLLGEAPNTEMKTFRHWFCAAYDKYVENPLEMPFDQHLFLAAIAPRAVLVEGFDDYWYDTEGEYLSCKAASPVWTFLGKEGLPDKPFPAEMDTSCIGANLGYVRRYGHHGLSAHDWTWLMDFADRNLRQSR